MKRIAASLLLASLIVLTGCTQDTPPASEVRDQFQRGLSGEGRVGPIDRSDDPYVRPRGGGAVSHP